MFINYYRLFFATLIMFMLQACGSGSNNTTQSPTTIKRSITEENYIDLAQFYFQRQSVRIATTLPIETLDAYKSRSIPGKSINSQKDTFIVDSVTPFNKYVESMTIKYNDTTIELDVVKKLYVSIKLYEAGKLIHQVEKTLHTFTHDGRLMPIEGDIS